MTRPEVVKDTPEEAAERVARLTDGLPVLAAQHRALAVQLRRPGGYRRWAGANCWAVDIDPDLGDKLGAAMADRLEAQAEAMTSTFTRKGSKP